jgi:phosphoglycolate phosphatase-like HAD superfamily hydrolase
LKNLIIFDLDGVITSEESYWDCAGLTLHELLYSPRYWHVSENPYYKPAASALESREISRATLPEWLILSFKARALNSNWDTCYAAVCLYLVDLLHSLPDPAGLLPLAPTDAAWTARLRAAISTADLARTWDAAHQRARWREQHPFDLPVFEGKTGLDLFERMDAYASQLLSLPIEGVFARSQPFWHLCQDLFQEWLLGDALYTRTHGHPPAQAEKPGCLFFEESLLPVERLRATLETLQARGYTLGVASGRVYQEAAKPLEKNGLLDYFDKEHIGTYDRVTRGEKIARAQGIATMLGKPHPFHFEAAVDWERALQHVLNHISEPLPIPFIAVGDSTSDILGGRAAGALTVAVLTGARTPEARELFLQSQPDFVIEDVTALPTLLEEIENLATIQKLQFERREVAEKLLRLWFARQMNLETESVRLTPKAVSLNSFNGFYTSAGQEFFFKTHVEEHGVLNEYYHADLLDQAGYNVVRPLRLVREKERQMVIYPVITAPVMFDLTRAQETGQELPEGITTEALLQAERAECQHLLEIYARTLQLAQDTSNAPIHQLFWHRLTKRFYEFYADKSISLPASNEAGADNISFTRLMGMRWIINGIEQPRTLAELVELGQRVLDPARTSATVVGHGDAHFGNVFLFQARYLYFDPAFAGHHPPLLDIVKPLFHNVFAVWMYFPQEVARDLRISVRIKDEHISVEHNYRLTPVRQAMLRIKQEQLLAPLLAFLQEQRALPEDWQTLLNLALMCCPLLTVNLFDETKRPPEIGWLGLSQALVLGNGGIAAWKEEQ